ncbi:hypothetical protein KR51_00032410 [Rubidibacter lacunae KORDI 51-2]|uniref:Phage shock protein A (IM30), suppresses sigma54-dependent transcription n=1 Tax=Rubidibacter lacunae KORDI 51-2 TaxID=582515 RepID=U5DKP5_9CHRO|nr:TIGR04376 family protein [Rubidibacter lacunae]ERN40295.1 hypothetical protein KR51_00032410 [Rubidibacter lacunae KORDI 51-2]
MSIFDDVNQFLETRLEEFLRDHPHLELQALEEQLREQEADTLRLIRNLEAEEKRAQDAILALSAEIKLWHGRIDTARAAGRRDLMQAALDKEASLLREGNQRWGQMQGTQQRLARAQELLAQVRQRRQEVHRKAEQVRSKQQAQQQQARAQTASSWESSDWQPRAQVGRTPASAFDPLEAEFQRLETDSELDDLKRNLGKR